MTMLTTPEQISRFQLLALRNAVKLEIYGMRRRGRSARAIAAEMLGMSRMATKEEVFDALSKLLGK